MVYDSKFGNTEKIAKALSWGMRKNGFSVDCVKIDTVDPTKLADYDLLAIGAPTQALGISGPRALSLLFWGFLIIASFRLLNSFYLLFEDFDNLVVVCFHFFVCSFSRIGEKGGHAYIDALLYLIDDFVSSAN